MRPLPGVVASTPDSEVAIRDADALGRGLTLRTGDLEGARQYIARPGRAQARLFAARTLSRFPPPSGQARQRCHQFYGVWSRRKVAAPPLGFYLLQCTRNGVCEIWQDKVPTVLPAGSAAIVHPLRSFRKPWHAGTRRLFLRIDRRRIEHEFRLWTGVDEAVRIKFELAPIGDMTKIGTLARWLRMLCDALNDEISGLSHPQVCDRMASGLASILLASMDTGGRACPPRRAIDRATRATPSLSSDLTSVAGVSTRTLQIGFHCFRTSSTICPRRQSRFRRTALLDASPQRRRSITPKFGDRATDEWGDS